jgi:hypothetical protein
MSGMRGHVLRGVVTAGPCGSPSSNAHTYRNVVVRRGGEGGCMTWTLPVTRPRSYVQHTMLTYLLAGIRGMQYVCKAEIAVLNVHCMVRSRSIISIALTSHRTATPQQFVSTCTVHEAGGCSAGAAARLRTSA